MSAPTTEDAVLDAAAGDADEHQVPTRAAQIDERAKKIYARLVKANEELPADQRESNDALRKQARGKARSELRRAAAQAQAKKVATNILADLGSVLHRNRRQLAPWSITAPYAILGLGAWTLAKFGAGAPVGIAVITALLAAAVMLLMRRKVSAPPAFRLRFHAGLFGLTAWTALMPLTTWLHPAGMWLLLISAVAYQSLEWWREHDHPIPVDPNALTAADIDLAQLDLTGITAEDLAALGLDAETASAALDATLAAGGEVDAAQLQSKARELEEVKAKKDIAERLVADWDVYVAGKGTLPGSTLTTERFVPYGVEFHLNLVRGKQTITEVRSAKAKFCAALNVEADMVSIDHGPDQSTIVLTVLTVLPSTFYDGPVIIQDGGEVYIEIGPYADGKGCERFHVLSSQRTEEELAAGASGPDIDGSMHGGFVLGTKGSGKSRLLDSIAVGLRALGIEIWYLDPQNGKSSHALISEADWPLRGMHGKDGNFSNLVKLWRAAVIVNELREKEGDAAGHQGFQHTRENPAIMIIIDECHKAFAAINPETGNTFGEDFANLDRVWRKNGMGLLGGSQGLTIDNFGGNNAATVLRDGMCGTNAYAMAYAGTNISLLPGYDGQPASSLPGNCGFGYGTRGERPHMRWQSRFTRNFREWLRKYPKSTLPVRTQKCIGRDYLNRFDDAVADKKAAEALLAAIDAAEGDASALLLSNRTSKTTTATTSSNADALLSPAQLRQRAAQTAAAQAKETATENSTTDNNTATPAATPSGVALTDAERRVLGIVATKPQTPTSLADQLGISPQGAGKHLRSLAEKGQLTKNDNGTYSTA
ncbi:hypothetical protein C8D87_12117 [Lentzea atacamensis]|uniref:Uncharacterized protein n=1 Tax=Lentzea atacamensis TaxID=531938 RepID=A0ABX9DXJ1_9PSEU|nr:winged helix-turn-helix domain-containing protein [Lentzea atacamensis]RAS57834.1 hypothetical protein C8D87_12117 [Lentzea atacamensis]